MARPLRIEFPGAIYHVTSRGNAQASIFLDDIDRKTFLSVLGLTLRRFNVICHAYCLMTNHFHLLLETPDANLSKAMRQLNSVYTQAFNALPTARPWKRFSLAQSAVPSETQPSLGPAMSTVILRRTSPPRQACIIQRQVKLFGNWNNSRFKS